MRVAIVYVRLGCMHWVLDDAANASPAASDAFLGQVGTALNASWSMSSNNNRVNWDIAVAHQDRHGA